MAVKMLGRSDTNNAAASDLDALLVLATNGDANATEALDSYPQTDGRTVASLAAYMANNAVFNVKDFGAVGDGVTDDAVAIQAALDAAASGQLVLFPATAGGFYQTSAGLTVPANVSVWMAQPVRYTGAANIAIVTIGDPDDECRAQIYRLGAYRTTRNWGDDAAVGVKLINLQWCRVDVFDCRDNTIGVLATGHSRGFTQNDVRFGELLDNKYAVVLESKGGSGANIGYVNENSWFGGNLTCSSGTLTTTSRYGVVIRSADAAYILNNNNVFWKPCFQMRTPTGGAESVGFVVEEGAQNSVVRGRFEAQEFIARFSGSSHRNYVDCGYADESEFAFEQLDNASENWVTRPAYQSSAQLTHCVFDTGDLARRTRGASGTSVMVEGCSWGTSSDGTRVAYSGTTVTYDADEVTVPGPRAIGVYVDTSVVKEFVVSRRGTNGGRVGITAYDASDVVLTDAGTVLGTISAVLTFTASYGGAFKTGSDTLLPVYFRVADNVDHAWVFVAGGDAPATLSGFSIFATPYTPDVRAYAGFQTAFLEGTATWNPGDLASGASTTTTVTVTGAAIGDLVEVSFSLSLALLSLTGYVSAANTVTAVLSNLSGGNVNLAEGTLRTRVTKGYAPV